MQEYPELENFRLDRHRISSHDLKFYIPILDIIYIIPNLKFYLNQIISRTSNFADTFKRSP